MLDIALKRFRIADGTGNPWYRGDVGVRDGRIVRIGKVTEDAALTIDGEDRLFLSPGFIDPHSHDEGCLFFEPSLYNKLSQGITTTIGGNCGLGLAPVSEQFWRDNKKVHNLLTPPDCLPEFTSFDRFLKIAEGRPIAINMGFLVGHGALRIAVMGNENRSPDAAELERMKDYLREALDSGATGLSFGLLYPPGSIAPREEFIELCKVVAERNKICTIHIRDEANAVIESVAEAISFAEESGVFMNISHHKAIGKTNWGKVKITLAMIERANERGLRIGFDQYPYNANCTNLSAILPPSYMVGDLAQLEKNLGDAEFRRKTLEKIHNADEVWDNYVVNVGFDGMLIMRADATPGLAGKTVGEYARSLGKDPFDTACDILRENKLDVITVYLSLSDKDVDEVMANRYGMVGSDGIYLPNRQMTHPRVKGSFPRVLGRYVRERGVLTVEEAIRKMTSLAAQRMGLAGKGLLREGFDADLVVFDLDTVTDTADFIKDCYGDNKGIEYVIVNGQVALKGTEYTGSTSGKILRSI